MKNHIIPLTLVALFAVAPSCTSPQQDADGDGVDAQFDCNDSDPGIYPGATDLCRDGIDQDCDGEDNLDCRVVEDPVTDWDEDGHDSTDFGGNDCNDYRSDIYPGATETPYDGIDQDCDGSDLTDVDGDGDAALEAGGGDCDDQDPSVSSLTVETPYDGIDQDCSGSDLTDVDGDGYPGEPAGGSDCDDTDPDIHPGAVEVPGDGVDENCDGSDVVDMDQDGYSEAEDCDDGDASVNPGQPEIACNLVDENCDGWLADVDCDGEDAAPQGADCDDTDPNIGPSAQEVACNDVDENCDGWVSDADCDGEDAAPRGNDCDDTDPLKSPDNAEVTCNDIDENCDGAIADQDCDGEDAEANGGLDCNDQNANIKPFAIELINGVDDNCNGEIDEVQNADDARVALDGDEGNHAGTGLAVGDFNGDGVQDIAVGAPEWVSPNGSQPGAVFIVYGEPGGLSDMALGDADSVIKGVGDQDRCGAALLATDINHDGADDLLIGAPGAEGMYGRGGAVYVVMGGEPVPKLFVDAIATVTIIGEKDGDGFGSVLAVAGDVDSDGKTDYLVGAPDTAFEMATGVGSAYLFLGVNLLNASSYLDADYTRMGICTGCRAGAYLAGVGDLNQDGYDDFAIGSPGTGQGFGRIELYFGAPQSSDWTPSGSRYVTYSGQNGELGPVVHAGDLDSDGADDLVVSAPGANDETGMVFVKYGPIEPDSSPLDVSFAAEASFAGNSPGSRFGTTMLVADLDNDGRPDLLIGAPEEQDNRGALYLFTGYSFWNLYTPARNALAFWSGDQAGQSIGAENESADLDGDGWTDLVASAPGDDAPGPSAGAVYGFVW